LKTGAEVALVPPFDAEAEAHGQVPRGGVGLELAPLVLGLGSTDVAPQPIPTPVTSRGRIGQPTANFTQNNKRTINNNTYNNNNITYNTNNSTSNSPSRDKAVRRLPLWCWIVARSWSLFSLTLGGGGALQ
jgi:hypothetical protein